MNSAAIVLSDDDYTAVLENLQQAGGQPCTIVLSDGTWLSFGNHESDTIAIAPGEEIIEVRGARMLTISGAVRIVPLPSEKPKEEN